MKQISKRKLPALVLAVCLIISNATMAFADAPTAQVQAPSLTAINTEITATAEYLKNSANINAASDFYNSSKLLILLLRSGINCSNLVDSYLSQVSATYITNGQLTLTDPLTDYAYLSMVLALAGKDATNFNGFNLIQKYETAITNADQPTLNNINPYKLPHLYLAAYAYSTKFKDSTSCLTKLKTAILSYGDANGINYWGNSADNNGFSLSGLSILSSTDSTIKTLVDNSILFSQTLLQSDGTSSGDFNWTAYPNSDSTAASLTLYSTYGKQDLAARSYAGLLTYKNTLQTGAYSYTNAADTASSYSTTDALYSLISYRAVLANQSSPFDVSDILASGLIQTNKPETETAGIAPTLANDSTSIIDTASTIDTAPTIDTTSTINSATDLSKTSPATGDSDIMTIFFLISLISACGVVAMIYTQYTQNMKNKRNDL